MIVQPFRGLRPRPDLASRIASPPYDVLDEEEARRRTRDEPCSFLNATRPEVHFPPGADPHAEESYTRARAWFRGMIERGHLLRDPQPAYYLYRLEMDGRPQTGVIGAAAVDDYVEGRIKRHEHTRPDKVVDRARLSEALDAHPGQVFLAYRDDPALKTVIDECSASDPAARFLADDGVEHALWVVRDADACRRIETAFLHLESTYIADGHHRAAAAAEVRERRGEAADSFLAAHFPASELRILEYNRVVRDLHGHEPAAFLERVAAAGFAVEPRTTAVRPAGRGCFGMYLPGRWYALAARSEIVAADDVVGRLDVSVLTAALLQPVLGIGDPRTDERIDFVGGIRGASELERRVDSGRSAVAFALYPTTLEEVMQVADAGAVMPPKSTWFEPKLREGLLVQLLGDPTL